MLVLEIHLDRCSTTHYLVFCNVLETFLQYMLYFNHFQHYIEKMDLEHVLNYQLFHLDKVYYMNLCFCQSVHLVRTGDLRGAEDHKGQRTRITWNYD